MFCTKCGTQLADGSKFCTGCGASLSTPEPAAAPAQAPAPQITYEAAAAGAAAVKKKKKTGLIVGLTAAVVVIAALVCAFFFWVQPTFLSDSAKYEKAMNAAEAALDEEDYKTAIAAYKTALGYAADDGQKTAVYLARAEACVKAEKYEDAIADYEAVLDIDEDQKKVWALMADAYAALGDAEKAIEVLNDGYEATEADSLLGKIDEIEAAANEGNDAGEGNGQPEPGPADDDPETEGPATEEPSDATEAPAVEAQPEEVEIGGMTFSTGETWLDLSGMDLNNADIEALVYFTELEGLMLENNNISDLSPLAGLSTLRYLYLYGNEISDLSPLAGLTDLEELSLWSNPVEELGPLSQLYNLRFLDLDYTLVSDVTPLFGLSKLETLYVSGDNLPADAWNQIAAALPQFSGNATSASIGEEFGYSELYFGMSLLLPYEYMSYDPFQDFCYIVSDMLGYELGITPVPVGYEEPDVDILLMLVAGEVDCALVRLPVEYNDDLFADLGLTWTAPVIETASGSLVICVREDDHAMLDMLNIAIEMMWSDGLMDELKAIWEEYGLSVWY